MSDRRHRAAVAGHAVTALVLFLKAFAHLEHAAEALSLIVLALTGGVIALSGALFHARLQPRIHHFDALMSGLESVICLLVGLDAMHRGTRAQHYAWLAAAALLLGAAVARLVRGRR